MVLKIRLIMFLRFDAELLKILAKLMLITHPSIITCHSLGEHFTGANWQFLVERKHSGEFRCTATNSIESGADKLTLNVQYGPIVKVKVSYCKYNFYI